MDCPMVVTPGRKEKGRTSIMDLDPIQTTASIFKPNSACWIDQYYGMGKKLPLIFLSGFMHAHTATYDDLFLLSVFTLFIFWSYSTSNCTKC